MRNKRFSKDLLIRYKIIHSTPTLFNFLIYIRHPFSKKGEKKKKKKNPKPIRLIAYSLLHPEKQTAVSYLKQLF